MEALVKLNSSRVGRDKIFRTAQYILKAVNSRPLANEVSRDLERTLASFRKLLRLGTFIDVLISARQSIHHPDLFTRHSGLFCLFTCHVNWSLYEVNW